MSVESVTTVETVPGVQACGELSTKPHTDPVMDMKAAVALGVMAVKKQAKIRAVRIKEVRVRLAAGMDQEDSHVLAQKMLEIE